MTERILKILSALVECFFIGLIIRFTLMFALEARLEAFLLNQIGYYMISGILATYVFWQVRESQIYNFFKERKRAGINSENASNP